MMLLLAGHQGVAQTGVGATGWQPRKWEVGAQLGGHPRIALAEAVDGAGEVTYVRPWPVMLAVRYHPKPRVSIEAGLLLRLKPTQTTSVTSSTGTYSRRTKASTWAVPLLVRVQVAPRQPQRWRLDAEFGAMPLSATYTEEASFAATVGGYGVEGSSSYSYRDLPVVVGLGGAYQVTDRFALIADARLSWSFLRTLFGRALTQRSDFIAPVLPSLSAGVSYQFGSVR
jgi:hypothetical protein